MIPADLCFHFTPTTADQRSERAEQAQHLLNSLKRSGQICGHPLLAWQGPILRASVYLAAPDALELAHFSLLAQTQWQAMNATLHITRLESTVPFVSLDLKQLTHLVLFTTLLDESVPLLNAENLHPIPLFQLPLSHALRADLLAWAEEYKVFDHLALTCGSFEIPAYRQLGEYNSALSQSGRQLCQQIEQATGLPTYYYLHRYWEHAQEPPQRSCPSCGHNWAQVPGQLVRFAFCCEPCRLVSQRGSMDDAPEYAKIGE